MPARESTASNATTVAALRRTTIVQSLRARDDVLLIPLKMVKPVPAAN
jgi:hypothetical protein